MMFSTTNSTNSSKSALLLSLMCSSVVASIAASVITAVAPTTATTDGYDDYDVLMFVGKRIPISLPILASCDEESFDDSSSFDSSSQNVSYTTTITTTTTTTTTNVQLLEQFQQLRQQQADADTLLEIVDGGVQEARYYATWTEGQLCSSKATTSFERWEESYGSLSECCDVVFGWDYDACCNALDMGGCM